MPLLVCIFCGCSYYIFYRLRQDFFRFSTEYHTLSFNQVVASVLNTALREQNPWSLFAPNLGSQLRTDAAVDGALAHEADRLPDALEHQVVYLPIVDPQGPKYVLQECSFVLHAFAYELMFPSHDGKNI